MFTGDMPQKKKAGSAKNGFHYFVLELINQQAQKGNRYSFPDAAKMADPKWAVSFSLFKFLTIC